MARLGIRVVIALGAAALIVACATPYGEQDAETTPDPSLADGGRGGGDSNAPRTSDGSAPGSDATAASDAGDDAGSYTEACPPCTQQPTCIAAGCSGGGTYNSCSKPYDITAPVSLLAFVCPEAPTVDFPQPCVPGGGMKDLRVAVFRMGKSKGNNGNWSVKVTGSNTFVAGEACGAEVTTCGGGTNGPSQPRPVAALTTALIGTTNQLATCQPMMITFAEAN